MTDAEKLKRIQDAETALLDALIAGFPTLRNGKFSEAEAMEKRVRAMVARETRPLRERIHAGLVAGFERSAGVKLGLVLEDAEKTTEDRE